MLVSAVFWVLATVLVVSAALVVSARNPVHSVLFLILCFFNAAGLFLLAGAEFLALILVVVYVGAVAVLFLFVVMMLDVNFTRAREGVQRYAPIGATIGLVLLAELLLVFGGYRVAPRLAGLSVAPWTSHLTNTEALGAVVYTRYVLAFQLAGLVLLVAMIGAIVLTLRDKPRARRQNIARQTGREVNQTLLMVDVRPGQTMAEIGIFRSSETSDPPPDLIGQVPLVSADDNANTGNPA